MFKKELALDLCTLFENHPSAMSAIIGAVIGSLTSIFGFAINGWFNLRSKEKDAENSIRQKQLENGFNFQKTHIIEPVIQFLESDLKLISQIYDLGLNLQHNEELSQRSSTHISMLPMIEARVSALSNSEASGKFQQFSRKRTEVGTAILGDEKPNINEAYEKLKESIHLASEILISLQNAIKQR